MRKISLVLLALITGVSVLGLSPIMTVNAQQPTPRLNFLALYAQGATMAQTFPIKTDGFVHAIIQNNIAFAFATLYKGHTLLSPLAHGWVALLGISRYVEAFGTGLWLLSVSNLKSVGSIFPGILEVYNDSLIDKNNMCDTYLTASTNKTEVVYYLYLSDYASLNPIPLSPQTNLKFNTTMSDVTYTWGLQYDDVECTIIDATNYTQWPNWVTVGISTMDTLNITYSLDFDPDGSVGLSQNLEFCEMTGGPVNWVGYGLSVIQFDAAQSLSFQLSLNPQAVNENGTVKVDPDNSTLVRNVNLVLGWSPLLSLDLSKTKSNYTWDGTVTENVTSSSVPAYTALITGHYKDGTYDTSLSWQRTITVFIHRICYNTWDGKSIQHDPIFGMTSPTPLLINFNINQRGWIPSAVIGGILAAAATIILISAAVVHRREK